MIIKAKEVGPGRFCAVWERCSTAREVAEELGLTVEAVRQRAHRMRAAGVQLRAYRPGRPRESVNRLKAEFVAPGAIAANDSAERAAAAVRAMLRRVLVLAAERMQ